MNASLCRFQRLIPCLLFAAWAGGISFLLAPSQAEAKSGLARQTDVELTGKKLAQLVHDRNRGDNSIARSVMGLISRRGKKRIRHFITYQEDDGKLLKQLIRFTSPADIEGTGFLSFEKEDESAEQFLYLPALRRTRRIVSSQKDHGFVNTDFTYEDMERRQVINYTHIISGNEKKQQNDCWILESRPVKKTNSQYSLIKSWIAKETHVPMFVEYYNKKGRLIKEYSVAKLLKIQGVWTEIEIVMADLERKHRTLIRINNITYNTELPDDIFTRRNLENW
ncbi:MAG: outer membrane lipoprotein-sorting protein [Deltaproteobacteria bacterium]|nr:outer membrane lipoprotein-sorting protein [Deltaproteobacteria bacterium]MBW2647930.1 outer membrane lipoprotein-sorting protein [Deltaproteobacteria bacterium]